MEIKKVVIIGSGTMGSGIAAHLCNANVPVTLLDLKTEISSAARDRIYTVSYTHLPSPRDYAASRMPSSA